MALEPLLGIFAVGTFVFFGLLGLVELLGKLYGTYRCLARTDLTGEQRLIYLALVWFVPLGWLIYLLLGTRRTRELFSEVEFL